MPVLRDAPDGGLDRVIPENDSTDFAERAGSLSARRWSVSQGAGILWLLGIEIVARESGISNGYPSRECERRRGRTRRCRRRKQRQQFGCLRCFLLRHLRVLPLLRPNESMLAEYRRHRSRAEMLANSQSGSLRAELCLTRSDPPDQANPSNRFQE